MTQDKKTAGEEFLRRVEFLKLANDWTWDQIAKKLHTTRGMLHFIRQGKYGVSKRNLFHLEQLEKEEKSKTSGARKLIEAVISNIEESKINVSQADFDKGFIDVPVKYARGTPPKGYPRMVRLRRPDAKASAKVIVDILANESYENVLLGCIEPRELATHEYVNLLTPFSFQALMDAAMELVFGANWRSRLRENTE
jgi:hypothetical protein